MKNLQPFINLALPVRISATPLAERRPAEPSSARLSPSFETPFNLDRILKTRAISKDFPIRSLYLLMSQDPPLQSHDLNRAKRILAGDRSAFEGFFEEYFDPLFRYALGRLANESLAMDVVQSTLCRAIEKLDTYRGEATLLSWMFSICRFEISAHHRSKKWVAPMSEEMWALMDSLPDHGPSVEDKTMQNQLKDLVHLTLDHLPSHYGRALEWKYLEGLPVVEIAERLSLGPKAAESVLTRARQAFRLAFKQLGEELARPQGEPLQALLRRSR